MFKKIGTAVILLITLAACNSNKEGNGDGDNPLLHKSTLPFQAPPFDKIEVSDFLPAFNKGMKQHLKEVDSIVNNPEAPTFKNTLVALEKSGSLLSRVQHVFNILTSANTNPKLQDIQKEVSPKLAAHFDAIYLNSELFQRVKKIYGERDSLNLDAESLRLVAYYYKRFVRAGAELSKADKIQLKKLNQKAASLSTSFVNKLLAAMKNGAWIVDDTAKLKGLSSARIEKANKDAEKRELSGKWLIPLQNTTQQPLLQELDNRDSRLTLFKHSWNRAEKGDSNDTRSVIKKLAHVRAEKAQLLGFDNYAAWKLQNQMAKNPQTVNKFLKGLVDPAVAKAKEEAADIQNLIDEQGGDFELAPADWNYYSQIIRQKRFGLNADSLKPYFELNNVLENGVFYAAHLLYGISFEEVHDIPVWQKDVRVFKVIDKDSSSIGLFYCDYFKRDNKGGGAWMSNLVTQSKLLHQQPVIYNVANFPKPSDGEPALLSFDEVTTMFHEFGHALHGFFANQKYPSLSGTSVARDFVEFPSQFNEHWALNPKVLKNYAVHYKTGKPIPKRMVEQIKKSAQFNQGYMLTELLSAAELDMQWHLLSAEEIVKNVDSFELKSLKKVGVYYPPVPPRYRSSYFMHIWGNGYSAGYYAYLWTEMLSDDAFVWFENHGGMTRENGQRLRDMILSQGNTEDLAEMYRKFTGHDPRLEPMLKDRGIE